MVVALEIQLQLNYILSIHNTAMSYSHILDFPLGIYKWSITLLYFCVEYMVNDIYRNSSRLLGVIGIEIQICVVIQ